MPKSKRQRVTTLSKTPGRTSKASKLALVNEIRENVDKFEHVWLFSVGDMRNEGLKDVRAQWRGTGRFFFGKTRVMAKALGVSAETEYEEGIGAIGRQLKGQIGIFCTSHPVADTLEWFETWSKKEYARQGAKAAFDVALPEGPLLTPWTEENNGDPFPHSMDPQLRALGLDTSLVRGVPSLKNAHVLCRKGEKLSSEKCRILKLLAVQMAEFKIVLGSHWTKGEGYVAGAELEAGDDEDEAGDMDED
ncbi:mRNA turnover and ribosome assembly protein [Vanrija albida]|uniref:Ribosome assembly factor mrt4 n=1 Tax=Vanrija albida TaxID=181172 RepID=A0ABR3PWX3_9TREE